MLDPNLKRGFLLNKGYKTADIFSVENPFYPHVLLTADETLM